MGFDLLKVTAGMGIILEKGTKKACIPMAQIHPSNVLGFLVKEIPTMHLVRVRGAPAEAETRLTAPGLACAVPKFAIG